MGLVDKLVEWRKSGVKYVVVEFSGAGMGMVYRVKRVVNTAYKVIPYGLAPLSAGDVVAKYEGGARTVPADGVLPGMCYTAREFVFPPIDGVTNTPSKTDMFLLTKEFDDRIIAAEFRFKPDWLRVELRIPIGVRQYRYIRNSVVGVDTLFGYRRGGIETIFMPNIEEGFVIGNDSNVDVYVGVEARYAEVIVDVPRRPETVADVLTGRVKGVEWVELPVISVDYILQRLREVYGFSGFRMPEPGESYAELVNKAAEDLGVSTTSR